MYYIKWKSVKPKFVPKYVIKHSNLEEKSTQKLIKMIDDDLQKYHFKSKDKTVVQEKKMLETLKQGHIKHLEEIRNPSGDRKQIMPTNIMKRFCNPGCRGTQFQETNYSKSELDKMFSNTFDGMRDNRQSLIKNYMNTRKTLRNKNKKMLDVDNFYHKFDPKTKSELKKDGAISGCSYAEGQIDGRRLELY